MSGLAAVAVAVPVGLLSVRYVRIFFGILTLAFGMLFHSFLFKFYDITGGDTGIRVLRPALLGIDFNELDKTAFLIGPFYYYCLVLLVVLGFVMWRIVHSPFGLHLTRDPREPAQGRVPRRARARLSACRVPDLRLLLRDRRRDPRDQHRPGRPGDSRTGRTPASSCS